MKTLSKLLTLILCFELILGPLGQSVVTSKVAEAKDCPAGQVFDGELGRCIMSSATIETNANIDVCRSNPDEEARKKCYQDNAQGQYGDRVAAERKVCEQKTDQKEKEKCLKALRDRSAAFLNKEGGMTAGNVVGSAATLAVPLLFLIKTLADQKKRGTACKPASLMLLYAGGAALLVGEVVTFIKHKQNLKRLEQARKDLGVKEDKKNADDNKVVATEAQSKSFGLLAENERSVASVAKSKKITYGIATGLFAAGAIMGAIESFQLKTAYAQLANTATVAQGQATIKRLTCGADPQGNVASDAKGTGTSAGAGAGTGTATGTGTAEGAGGGEGLLKTAGKAVVSGVASSAVSAGMNAVTKPKEAGSGSGTASGGSNNNDKPTVDCGTMSEVPEVCEGTQGCYYNYDAKSCVPTSASLNIQELLNLNIKMKAAKNLESAENYGDLAQLMAELESIDYENYSRTSYYDDLLFGSLNEIKYEKSVAQLVADQIFPKAHAIDPCHKTGDCVNEAGEYNGEGWNSSGAIAESNISGNSGGVINEVTNSVETKPGSAATVQGAKSQVKGIMNKAVYTPQGRLITNGLLGGWMGIMTSHMTKQEKLCNARADLLDTMQSEFDSQAGLTACTSADRKNPGKPLCYCYTADNKKNPEREKSKICNTAYLALNKANLNNNTPKVCIDQNMNEDVKCSCRNRKGPDGKNACMRIGSGISFKGLNPGTFKMISASAGPANDLFGGTASPDNFDAGSISANAAKLSKIADDAVAKDPVAKKGVKNMGDALLASTKGMSMGGAGFSSGSNPAGMTPAKAAAELAKELRKEETAPEVKAGGSGSNAAASFDVPAEEAPEFGMTQDQLADQETEIQEVMSQDLDMAQSDISSGSDTNIFDQLSNRYKRSGMRRLFDKEEEVKADAPAKTDIAE